MKVLATLIFFALSSMSLDVVACSCHKMSIEQKYVHASYVARVKVSKVIDLGYERDPDIPWQQVYFSPVEEFKGGGTIGYLYEHTPVSGLCGIGMEPQQEYIVFVNREGVSSVCGGSFFIESGAINTEAKLATIRVLSNPLAAQNK